MRARKSVDRRVGIRSLVVGRRQLGAADVGLDDVRVITADLDEQHLEAGAARSGRAPSRGARAWCWWRRRSRPVRRPRATSTMSSSAAIADRPTRLFALRVVGIEEAVRHLGADPCAPVLADVEDARAVAEPRQVALDAARGVALAARGQPDHHEREPVVQDGGARHDSLHSTPESLTRHRCRGSIEPRSPEDRLVSTAHEKYIALQRHRNAGPWRSIPAPPRS